jgi:hypothetical protein
MTAMNLLASLPTQVALAHARLDSQSIQKEEFHVVDVPDRNSNFVPLFPQQQTLCQQQGLHLLHHFEARFDFSPLFQSDRREYPFPFPKIP